MYFLAKDIDHCAPNLLLFLAISSQPLCKGLGQSNRDHPLEKPMFLPLHMNNKDAQRGQWNKEGMLSGLNPDKPRFNLRRSTRRETRERPDALHLKPHIILRTMPTEVNDLFTLGRRDGNTRQVHAHLVKMGERDRHRKVNC